MSIPGRHWLLVAAACNALAALLHLGCIVGGPAWYRFFGAGEQMARMAARGHWYPTFMAVLIATMLFVWSAYALSGAGLIRRLPLRRIALVAITAVYLLRGIGFAALQPYFPGNSAAFWGWSSGICLAIGIVHFIGVRRAWPGMTASARTPR